MTTVPSNQPLTSPVQFFTVRFGDYVVDSYSSPDVASCFNTLKLIMQNRHGFKVITFTTIILPVAQKVVSASPQISFMLTVFFELSPDAVDTNEIKDTVIKTEK